MGKFIDTLKKRGAYQYGSRALGVPSESSDYDWALPMSIENADFLMSCGFMPDSSASGRSRRNVYGRCQTARPVTDFPGMKDEQLCSYRKGNTNVVLMSAMLFEATKYATKMTATYPKEQLRNMDMRVMCYQRFSSEYAQMVKG